MADGRGDKQLSVKARRIVRRLLDAVDRVIASSEDARQARDELETLIEKQRHVTQSGTKDAN